MQILSANSNFELYSSIFGLEKAKPGNPGQQLTEFLTFQEDEEAFQTFSVYCGLALHHAKLYDKIRRSEQKYKVHIFNSDQFI